MTKNKYSLENETQEKALSKIKDECCGNICTIVKLISVFGTFCVVGAVVYGAGIVHSALLDRFQASVGLTSWAGALMGALMLLSAPVSSTVINRFSCRAAIIAGGVLFTSGFVSSVFAPTIEVAIFTLGILAGLGAGLSCTASMMVVAFNFKKRMKITYGIATSGMGTGLTGLAPLFQYSRGYYGNAGFFFIMASASIHLLVFGLLCPPNKVERSLKEHRKQANKTILESVMLNLNVLKNKGVICLSICLFSYCFGLFMVTLHLPKYISVKQFTDEQAANVLSISGIVSVFGRLIIGAFANLKFVNPIAPFSGSMCMISAIIFVYPFISEGFDGHIAFGVVFGLFQSNCFVLITPVILQFVDMASVSTATGLVFMFGGVGAIAGPVCAGTLVDSGGTYEQSLLIGAGFVAFSGLASALSACFRREKNTNISTPHEENDNVKYNNDAYKHDESHIPDHVDNQNHSSGTTYCCSQTVGDAVTKH